ncbi:MAG TPA: hypothetical protein VMQ76_05540 [Terracidiphilus sp.]|nr:hypothetical protein [Terracidiphilus sp.]
MTITGLTPSDIVDLADKEINLTRIILETREAKMLGVPERGLSALLKGKIKDIKDALKMDTTLNAQSIIMPFIQRLQSSFINDNYFTITAAAAPTDAGTGTVPASAWDFTVSLGSSWLATDMAALEHSFVVGSTLQVLTWTDFVTKTAQTLEFVILRAVNADVGSTHYAKVTVVPNITASAWTALTAGQKALYHPTYGVAQTGTNSVDDREQYCYQPRADLSRNLVVSWIQTMRTSICTQQSYEEALDAILAGKVNDYLKGFKYQSLADQERQKLARSEREWLNSVMFGQVINENQTTALWRSLPAVLDPVDTTCQLGVKSNALGFFTLLNNCNRTIDMAGAPLSLDYIFQQLYYLRRNRQATGDNVDVIDSLTDRYTAGLIFEAMSKYYETRYSVKVERFAKMNEKIEHDGFLLFNYNIYDVPDEGVRWLVAQDDYFNDLIDAFPARIVGWDFKIRARNLWFIDWSDVSVGVLRTKAVTRKNPDPATADVYKCVIQPNVNTYQLRSKTWTALLDRPNRHLIIYNFAGTCPTVSVPGCTVPQS